MTDSSTDSDPKQPLIVDNEEFINLMASRQLRDLLQIGTGQHIRHNRDLPDGRFKLAFFSSTSPIVREWKMPTDWHLLIMVKFVKIDGQIFRRKRLFIRLLSPARGCWRKLLSDPIAPSITSSYHQVNTLQKTITNNGFQDYEEDEKPLPEDLGEMAPPIPKEDDWGAILGWCLSSGSIAVTIWFVCLESKDFQHFQVPSDMMFIDFWWFYTPISWDSWLLRQSCLEI